MSLLHASPQPDAEATADPSTGEVRIPIELWSLDRPQGPTSLVLSAREAAEMHERLGELLTARQQAPLAGIR
ncbi:hypothetical protein [Streptomyces sp. C10-9-1]|uniref:hypothetical protein n=1 Tax=Streptomyces sp. C10-9-1 TaxID=1859285 RepID=UPI003D747C57